MTPPLATLLLHSAVPCSDHHVDDSGGEPLARAQAALVEVLRWLAGVDGASCPDLVTLSSFLDAPSSVRAIATELGARICTAAVLQLDAPTRRTAGELSETLARDGDSDDPRLWATLASLWNAIADGVPLDDSVLAQFERKARERKVAELVVDAASLRALVPAGRDSLDDAVECARRAWRMARTEKIPHSGYLAGLTLARLRRLKGNPYLAARIASTLGSFASRPWYPWIDWELMLASGSSAPTLSTTGPARQLRDLLEQARAGNRLAFDAARSRLQVATADFSTFAHDLRNVLVALDPEQELATAPPRLAQWLTGTPGVCSAPLGLAGLNGHDHVGAATNAVADVLVVPHRVGRRVLRIARGLALQQAEGRCIDDGKAGRPEAVLSALALAGPSGMDESDLFRSVYGFEYARSLHRGTFDVALHRARSRLGQLGEIDRADRRMRLRVDAPFVVVDPRCTAEVDDRVLALVARSGEISARDAAQSLGIPLRTVQGSLRKLVDGGACLQQRAGRKVVYTVEDTTFQEPTLPG